MRIIHPNRPAGEVTVSGLIFKNGVAEVKSLDDSAMAVLTDHGFTVEKSKPGPKPKSEQAE